MVDVVGVSTTIYGLCCNLWVVRVIVSEIRSIFSKCFSESYFVRFSAIALRRLISQN
jgi:hypothetical protein